MMIKPDIAVYSDYVLFDRRRIDRPRTYSVTQWTDFWEKVKILDKLTDNRELYSILWK
jgi:hypothetical protein